VLLKSAMKRENQQVAFYAKVHGAKLKGGKSVWRDGDTRVVDTREIYNGDPRSVEHMSPEAREQMTRDLIEKLKGSMPKFGN
jgi:hypothetical protein